MIYVEDAETGEQIFVDSGDPGFQRRLRAAADERQAALVAAARTAGVELFTVTTDEDLVRALARIAELRRRGAHDLRLALAAADPRRDPAALWDTGDCSGDAAARAAELAALGLVPAAPAAGRRRHVAPALFLGALALLFVALARPQATIAEPRREGTVVLAFDVSGSMAAKDVEPTPDGRREGGGPRIRRAAAVDDPARRRGVRRERRHRHAQPTDDHAAVLAAIDRLSPQGGTALGRGIQTSLSAIAGRTWNSTARAGRRRRRARTSATTAPQP